MSKNKNTNSQTETLAGALDFSNRLAKSGGRIVGVTTVVKNRIRKVNGQVKNVTPSYVTIYDRNQKQNVKFALSSIVSVRGV